VEGAGEGAQQGDGLPTSTEVLCTEPSVPNKSLTIFFSIEHGSVKPSPFEYSLRGNFVSDSAALCKVFQREATPTGTFSDQE
jgi:hypothetical protein